MKNVCFNISISLLLGLFVIFLMSALGFLFNLSITPVYTILGIIFAIFSLVYFTICINKLDKKILLAEGIFLFNFLLICGLISYFLVDISYDGSTYHLASVVYLKTGWNPIYESIYNFANSQNFQFPFTLEYVEYFLKGYEILGANIYSVFDKIELTKILKFIFCLIAFCYAYYTLKKYKLSDLKTYILSFAFVFNPVCAYQFASNYVDDVFYYLFLVLIFSLINICRNIDVKYSIVIYFVSGLLLANVKLTGMVTFLLLSVIFLIVFKSKDLLKILLVSLFVILLTGINPYIINVMEGNNPFYPIVKESFFNANREYMITSYPSGFENKNRFEKFFISNFSCSQNLSPLLNNDAPTLKLPFLINKDEMFHLEDMRVGGFGYFFSGILILSIVLSIFLKFSNKEDKKLFFTLIFAIIMSVFINHEAWWARFVPQFWALPLFICLYTFIQSGVSLKIKVLQWFIILVCFINSSIVMYQYTTLHYKASKAYFEALEAYKNYPEIYFSYKQLDENRLLQIYQIRLKEIGLKTFFINDK